MSTGADDLTTEHYFGSLVNHILNRDPINPTGNYASGVVLAFSRYPVKSENVIDQHEHAITSLLLCSVPLAGNTRPDKTLFIRPLSIPTKMQSTSSSKHSLMLMLFFGLVSKKGMLRTSANRLPSSGWTSRSLERWHLLPTRTACVSVSHSFCISSCLTTTTKCKGNFLLFSQARQRQ